MKPSDIRALTLDELNLKLSELKRDLFNLRLQHAINQLDNPLKISDVKKNIARINTIIRQKQSADKVKA